MNVRDKCTQMYSNVLKCIMNYNRTKKKKSLNQKSLNYDRRGRSFDQKGIIIIINKKPHNSKI